MLIKKHLITFKKKIKIKILHKQAITMMQLNVLVKNGKKVIARLKTQGNN